MPSATIMPPAGRRVRPGFRVAGAGRRLRGTDDLGAAVPGDQLVSAQVQARVEASLMEGQRQLDAARAPDRLELRAERRARAVREPPALQRFARRSRASGRTHGRGLSRRTARFERAGARPSGGNHRGIVLEALLVQSGRSEDLGVRRPERRKLALLVAVRRDVEFPESSKPQSPSARSSLRRSASKARPSRAPSSTAAWA